jgi:uncharacterized protein
MSMKKLFFITAASLIATSALAADTKPTFRLCTGAENLNYNKAGHILKKNVTSVNVEVITTKGSLDNLDKLAAGECDGAYVQSDAMAVYSSKNAAAISQLERAGSLYNEQAHLICNREKANMKRMVDLTKDNKIAVGPDGAGTRTTWDGFVMADKKRYGSVQVDSKAGQRALGAVADGSDVQCALIVSALNSSFMKNEAQAYGDKLILVGTDDRDMASLKDAKGKYVYSYSEIPAGTYPKIQPGGTIYGTKAIPTIQVEAIFVASTKFIDANEKAYDGVLRGFTNARPEIAKLIQPQ